MKLPSEISAYERLEIETEKEIEYIKIHKPDESTDYIKSFLYQPILVKYDEMGLETIEKNGDTKTLFRYTPELAGDYLLEFCVKDEVVEKRTLKVTPSSSHGYVEISKKDSSYFAYTDGTPFFMIGLNTAFISPYPVENGAEFGLGNGYRFLGLRQYERWFKKCSANGVNVARIWLGHEYFNPDTENTYELDLVKFSKIDELIKLAKKYDIKLKLTIEQFRYFDYVREGNTSSFADDVFRKFNKRLYDNGKRCESSDEWLTDKRWGEAFMYKVSELAKRYSGDTAVFMVELWNEMNCVGDKEQVISWNRIHLPKVKELFKRHLVTNSLGSLDAPYVEDYYNAFCWELSDAVQMHRYIDQGAQYKVCTKPIDMIKDGFEILPQTGKPRILAETGAVNNCHSGPFRYYVNDHRGIIFADTVYTPVFMKSCSTGNIWHWDERYVEAKNLYKMFSPIKSLTEDICFDGEDFESVDYSNDELYVLLLKGKNTLLGYIRNKSDSWQNVLRDLNEPTPVSGYKLPIDGVSEIVTERIWDEETAETKIKDGRVTFSNIKYGLLFKARIGGV